MLRFLILGLSGALGTICRYWLSGWVHQLFGTDLPYGTFLVNVTGCLLIGFLGTLANEKLVLSSETRLALFIGFLGAFTTFSSFSFETWNLFKEGQILEAGMTAISTLVVCFLVLILGVFLARLL